MIRALLRFALAAVATLLVTPPVFLAWAIRCGAPALGRRLQVRVTHVWARMMVRALWLRVEAHGSVPPAPCLLISNHVSYLDVLVLASLAPTCFVSRADISGWPLMGPLARLAGTIFLERERRRDTHRATGDVELALADGVRVVIFAEGTAGPGDTVRPFRSSFLHPAVSAGVESAPIRLRYSLRDRADLDPREVVAWHRGAPFGAHAVRLARSGRVGCDVAVLPPRRGTDRKILAAELEADVRAALEA